MKAKRKILLSLKDRLKNKFNVSVAELEDNDLWQKCVLGVAIISNKQSFANAVLTQVANLVNSTPELIVSDMQMEWL